MRPFNMEFASKHREHILLGLLIVALTVIHLVWLVQDHGPLPIPDGYIYLTQLLHFIHAPAPTSLHEAWSALEGMSLGGRPPLYQLLTIPSILLLGRSVAAACTINLIFLPILLISTYVYAKSISGARAGLLAAFLVGTYSPIVQLTHNYMPYSVLPACGMLSLWLLAQLQRHRSVKIAWLFGGSLAFGLLIHPQFLRFAAPTVVIFGLYIWLFPQGWESSARSPGLMHWLKSRFSDPLFLWGLLPAAGIVIALVLPWYLTTGYRLLAVTRQLNSGVMEDFRGKAVLTIGFEAVDPSFWFLRTAPGTMSWILALAALVGLLFGIFKRRPSTWILVVSLVSTYAIFSRLTTRAWWGFAVVLPIAAVLTALWVTEIRPRWLSLGLTVLCLAAGSFNFSMVTWGLNPALEPLAVFLGSTVSEGKCPRRAALSLCPAPARPAPESVPEFDAVKVMAEDSNCYRRPYQVLKVGGAISWLQLRYFAAAWYPGCTLHVAGPRSPNFGRPFGLIDLLRSDYLLYPEGVVAGRNLYDAALLEFLHASPPAFSGTHEEIGTFGQLGEGRLVLAKRTGPLTALEVEESIAALGLDEKYMSQRFGVLSSLYESEGNADALARLYEEALEFPVSIEMQERVRIRLERVRMAVAKEEAETPDSEP